MIETLSVEGTIVCCAGHRARQEAGMFGRGWRLRVSAPKVCRSRESKICTSLRSQGLIDELEKDLLETNQTPEELMAEAQRVRAEVPQGDGEMHKAFFMYAANLELVAAEREAGVEVQ
jgi:hypothetical protein